MIQLIVDSVFIISMMVLGSWLEGVGNRTTWLDDYFTPLPLGISGMIISALEWVLP